MEGIRLAKLEDIPDLCNLLSILFTQEADFQANIPKQEAGLKHIILNPDIGRILVYQEEKQGIAGMINLLFTISTAMGGTVAILEDLIVNPSSRGRGIGSKLLESGINLARQLDCLRITLLTDHDNEQALQLYEKAGFKRSQMIPMRLVF
jgi:ribosomal protein S18 acetylase RimI-like enzyme